MDKRQLLWGEFISASCRIKDMGSVLQNIPEDGRFLEEDIKQFLKDSRKMTDVINKLVNDTYYFLKETNEE